MANRSAGMGLAVGIGAVLAVGIAFALAGGGKKKSKKGSGASANGDSDDELPPVGPPVPDEMMQASSPVTPGVPPLHSHPAQPPQAAPSYPAPKLVQLRKPKPLGIFNYHHRGIGHTHAHFNHGG